MLSSSWKRRVALIGANGDVGQKKILPALEKLFEERVIDDYVLTDIKSPAEVVHDAQRQRYMQTSGVSRIVMELADKGFLGPDVAVLVATPTWHHVDYAMALHDHVGCIGVEKPIAWTAEEAQILAKLQRVYPIEHQVYKSDAIALNQQSAARRIRWSTIRDVRFFLHEESGVGNREIDHIIADTGYHGFAVLLSAISQCHRNIRIRPSISLISTYEDGPDTPKECTAAFMAGVVTADDNVQFSYAFTVGKGLSSSRKGLTLFRDSGEFIQTNLDESGFVPHKRVIESMLGQKSPLLSVADSITIVEACEKARTGAQVRAPYAFGSTPQWLNPAPRRIA